MKKHRSLPRIEGDAEGLATIFRTLKAPAFYNLKHLRVFYTASFSPLMVPALTSPMFVAVQLPNTKTYLSHVRRSPTSCPTSTLIPAMFVAIQLPV